MRHAMYLTEEKLLRYAIVTLEHAGESWIDAYMQHEGPITDCLHGACASKAAALSPLHTVISLIWLTVAALGSAAAG